MNRRFYRYANADQKTAKITKPKKKIATRYNVISPGTKKYMEINDVTVADLPPSGSGKHGAYLKKDIDTIIKKKALNLNHFGSGSPGSDEEE